TSFPANVLMSAEAEIRRRIHQKGPITFAAFMEIALFWSEGGYYLSQEPFGASGDYYTSPLVHPAFGALLAVQLLQMWRLMGRPNPFQVVEMGAGNGMLCRDIISYVQHLSPEFQRSLCYVCHDRRACSGAEKGLSNTSRIVTFNVPLRGVKGCFLSNEFLDSFPIHQVRKQQGRLQEVYVALESDEFVEVLGEPSASELVLRLECLGIELVEGQTVEINLGLDQWAEEVASALESGVVLTVDYGHSATQLYSAEVRPRGTLTTYYRHTQTDAPFRRIGQQDMSAHVDFTSVINAGSRAGLEPMGLTTQGRFLHNLGLGRFLPRLPTLGLSNRESQANRAGLVDLARAGGLGDFKVLIQAKNVGQPRLWGLQHSDEAANLIDDLPVPLLTPQHLSLLEGRYPQAEYEVELEDLWPQTDDLDIDS
ncbi:MAG TPA: SAM-dependent methyltransferase, partial [Dehalococcoidia bacterium]|nr:SAM-dependent methyltransferase [Dehalococcoidia bacterium]